MEISTLFYTIKHLTPRQLCYQLLYKLTGISKSISKYSEYDQLNINIRSHLQFNVPFFEENVNLHSKSFTLLNRTQQFNGEVNWDFQGFGKLWNYHLQYLNVINDEQQDLELRKNHLKSCSEALLSGKLRAEPYPVSLRLWNTAIFFSRHGIQSNEVALAFKRQIAYLENHIEYHIDANHLLENLIVLYASTQWLSTPNNSERINSITKRFHRELKRQILHSGAHYELSGMYHLFLLERLKACQELIPDDQILNSTIISMNKWFSSFLWPDDSWPNFGDSCGANQLSNLSLTSFKQGFANQVIATTKNNEVSTHFPYPYFKYSNNYYSVVIKIAAPMPSHQPGHSHADIGSFCLWSQGKEHIMDPGITTYEVNSQRLWERSTASHNTVCIDGKNQSDVWSAFRVGYRASISWHIENESCLVLKCTYKGLEHKRKFYFRETSLSISDSIKGKHERACIRYTLADSDTIDIRSSNSLVRSRGVYSGGFNRSIPCNIVEVIFKDNCLSEIHINNTKGIH